MLRVVYAGLCQKDRGFPGLRLNIRDKPNCMMVSCELSESRPKLRRMKRVPKSAGIGYAALMISVPGSIGRSCAADRYRGVGALPASTNSVFQTSCLLPFKCPERTTLVQTRSTLTSSVCSDSRYLPTAVPSVRARTQRGQLLYVEGGTYRCLANRWLVMICG